MRIPRQEEQSQKQTNQNTNSKAIPSIVRMCVHVLCVYAFSFSKKFCQYASRYFNFVIGNAMELERSDDVKKTLSYVLLHDNFSKF